MPALCRPGRTDVCSPRVAARPSYRWPAGGAARVARCPGRSGPLLLSKTWWSYSGQPR